MRFPCFLRRSTGFSAIHLWGQGVIAENISAEFPRNFCKFCGISTLFPGAINRILANFRKNIPQNFRKTFQTKNPQDPAVLKILRVVNLLRVAVLVPHCDFLSRRTLWGRNFPGNCRHFPLKEGSERSKCGGRSKKHYGVVIHYFFYRQRIFCTQSFLGNPSLTTP